MPWLRLLTLRQVWGLVSAKFLSDAAGFGSMLGGWFSSRLLRSGASVNKARKLALVAGYQPVFIVATVRRVVPTAFPQTR